MGPEHIPRAKCDICGIVAPVEKVENFIYIKSYTDINLISLMSEFDYCSRCYNTTEFENKCSEQLRKKQAELDAFLESQKKPKPIGKLFTFTTSEDHRDREATQKFIRAVHSFCSRAFIKKAIYCFEHVSSNLHAHVYFEHTNNFKTRDLKCLQKFGLIKKQTIYKDNGVENYIRKEQEDKHPYIYTYENGHLSEDTTTVARGTHDFSPQTEIVQI